MNRRLLIGIAVVVLGSGLAGAGAGCATLTPAPVRTGAAPAPRVLSLARGERPALTITRVAHASVLIEVGGQALLTDPWFSEKSGYYHGEPLGIALGALPRLAGVVASHGHYDHFDIETFAAYPDKAVPFAVRTGMGEAARKAGFGNIHELEPWQSAQLGPFKVTAAPGSHSVPENTYVIEVAGYTIYFGGDTRSIPELDEVAKRYPRIDVALLPVNGLKIRPLLGRQEVMSAEQAAALCGKLQPAVAIPTHYRFTGGGFGDTVLLDYDGTPERFVAAASKIAPAVRVEVLEPGEPLRLVPASTQAAAP